MKEKLKRKDILKRVSKAADATLGDSAIFMDAFLEVIAEALVEGYVVSLRGFGTFDVRERKQCKTTHPDTKEEVVIDGHNVCKFTQSPVLRKRINESG